MRRGGHLYSAGRLCFRTGPPGLSKGQRSTRGVSAAPPMGRRGGKAAEGPGEVEGGGLGAAALAPG